MTQTQPIDIEALRALLAEVTIPENPATLRIEHLNGYETNLYANDAVMAKFWWGGGRALVDLFVALYEAAPALLEENARLKAELTQARNENMTLHARMGNIIDLATMPLPDYYHHQRIG